MRISSNPALPSPPRRVLVLPALALVGLAGVATYGLLAGGGAAATASSASPSAHDVNQQAPSTILAAPPADLAPGLPQTTDPVAYATALATTLFTWDTMAGRSIEDHARTILAEADPVGSDTAGLVADLANYLPNREVWLQLRTYATRQTITIHDARVPHSWAAILAANSSVEPGTVAVTITATRHRVGYWHGRPANTEQAVTFTVFLHCPSAGRCRPLRLSRLDQPLN